MLPVIALVGRPNVGKSTLFNYLTRTRDALVADYPGLTRDRQYGYAKRGPCPFLVVDTGGISGDTEGMDGMIADQVEKALEEADAVLFLADGRAGLHPSDEIVARRLRDLGKPARLIVNKLEGMTSPEYMGDFYRLGMGEPKGISAERGDGVASLLDEVLGPFIQDEDEEIVDDSIRVAIIGRPNAGKSTLINGLLNEERVLASEVAGTTRDSIDVPFSIGGKDYTLIDTAGVRRRSKVDDTIEKFSVIKTMQAIDRAHVCIVTLDATLGAAEQDARLIGLAIDRGRSLVVILNKWDLLDDDERLAAREQLEYKFPFLQRVRVHSASALRRKGFRQLMMAVDEAYTSAMIEMPTSKLNELLEQALRRHQMPAVRSKRSKLRFAHQSESNPPTITIHGNQTDLVPASYRRYLSNFFIDAFNLWGGALRVEFKTGDNPYAGRKRKLTDRQVKKRRRMMKHVKRK